MSSSANPFAAAAAAEVARATGLDSGLFTVSAPPKPELGDFAVGLFPAAKELKKAPAAIASEVASAFEASDLLSTASAAGPFVNFRANRPALFEHLARGDRAVHQAEAHPFTVRFEVHHRPRLPRWCSLIRRVAGAASPRSRAAGPRGS